MTSIGFILTVIFMVLKLNHNSDVVSWSWWLVLLPVIIGAVVDVLLVALFFTVWRRFTGRKDAWW